MSFPTVEDTATLAQRVEQINRRITSPVENAVLAEAADRLKRQQGEITTLRHLLRSCREELHPPVPGETAALCRCIDDLMGPFVSFVREPDSTTAISNERCAIPEGWSIVREGDTIAVQGRKGGYVAYSNRDNIPCSILYYLASDMLDAPGTKKP